tara:strand:- start:5309 stop:5776 length:468 start_codon:yes stop_codon:yes gene_type:complete
MLIEKDLRDASLMYDEYVNVTKDDGSMILIKALMRSIVVTYGMCFVSAEGTKIKLVKNIVLDEHMDAHKQLIEMRQQYVSRAGQGYETCIIIYVLHSSKVLKQKKLKQEEVIIHTLSEISHAIGRKLLLSHFCQIQDRKRMMKGIKAAKQSYLVA